MVGPIAPVIETQVYAERPVAPPSTSMGELFGNFLRATKPVAPSASAIQMEADRGFMEAFQAAEKAKDEGDQAGANQIMLGAAMSLVSVGQDLSEDQEAFFTSITGRTLASSLGVDTGFEQQQEWLGSTEGRGFLSQARNMAEEAGKELTPTQLEALAIQLGDDYLAKKQMAEQQRLNVELGLPVAETPIVESIKADTRVMFSLFNQARADGVVTEEERLGFSQQVKAFASLTYGEYRKGNPTVDAYLTQLEGLAKELSEFDELEFISDGVQKHLMAQDLDPLTIAVVRNLIASNPQYLVDTSVVSLSNVTGAISTLNLEDIFKGGEGTLEVIEENLEKAKDDIEYETAVASLVGFELNNFSKDFSEQIQSNKSLREGFSLRMGALLLAVEKQDDTILSKGHRSLLLDPNFKQNLSTIAAMNPSKGDELMELYKRAVASELNRIDTQIGRLGKDFLLVDPDTGVFSLDRDAIVAEAILKGAGQTEILEGILDKVDEAGGFLEWFNTPPAQRDFTKDGVQYGPSILAKGFGISGSDLEEYARLQPERKKLMDAVDDLEITHLVETAIASSIPVETPEVEDSVEATELGRLGSEKAPYKFEGMSDDQQGEAIRSLSVGSFFVNPADGVVYEVLPSGYRNQKTREVFK